MALLVQLFKCPNNMMNTTLELSDKWAPVLIRQPETGMGYQVTTIILKDGRRFSNVTIAGGAVTCVNGYSDIPFREDDIADIVVTHGNDQRPEKDGHNP